MVQEEAPDDRPDRVARKSAPAITEIAFCRSCSPNMTGMTEIAIGKTAAAPMPSAARAAISSPTLAE